jgi:UDP-N-acetylglucosamine 2-epimerase (non-hydrolysing)
MIDSLRDHLEAALCSEIRRRLIPEERYGLVTLHRPANVDDEVQLSGILCALTEISKEVPLYWPVHPRTRSKLDVRAPIAESIHLLDPLGYLDFLALEAQSAVVLTDSGGIQEETTVLGIPCLTLRKNTERPVTIDSGTNRLAGTSRDSILKAWRESVSNPKVGCTPPLWDGSAGARARAVLRAHFEAMLH